MTFSAFKNKVFKLFKQVRGAFPSRLPRGVSEFEALADSIIELYNPPCDSRSVRFIIATLIMRLGPTEAFKSKIYFALSIYRGAAGQVSAHVMELIKQEQAAEQLQAKQTEATAQGASNVSKSV